MMEEMKEGSKEKRDQIDHRWRLWWKGLGMKEERRTGKKGSGDTRKIFGLEKKINDARFIEANRNALQPPATVQELSCTGHCGGRHFRLANLPGGTRGLLECVLGNQACGFSELSPLPFQLFALISIFSYVWTILSRPSQWASVRCTGKTG